MRALVTSATATVLASLLMTQMMAASGSDAPRNLDRWVAPAQVGYYAYEWYDYHYGDQEATVSTSEEYRLEDGTYLGSSGGNWQDCQCNNSGLAQNIAAGMVGQVGAMAGYSVGSSVGTWAGGVVAAGGSTAAGHWGAVLMVSGPWVGAVVGIGIGIA